MKPKRIKDEVLKSLATTAVVTHVRARKPVAFCIAIDGDESPDGKFSSMAHIIAVDTETMKRIVKLPGLDGGITVLATLRDDFEA